MSLLKLLQAFSFVYLWVLSASSPVEDLHGLAIRQGSGNRQNIVTYDQHSIFVRGQRILFYSGEVHPFRLPVPDLWLDIFQKIKALGYTGVSFYANWALLEGEPGVFRSAGVFALEPFFDAAAEAGIYLLARPGPYINAEVSGGGFPGWLARVNATYRTNDTGYIQATALYNERIGSIIAKAQITNGGPVILFQPENEYTSPSNGIIFPNYDYFGEVINAFENAGIVVPLINNDAAPLGNISPDNSSATALIDIYGHDGYPLGFNCQQPYNWTANRLPTTYRTLHEEQSPSTAYSIVEFQGGSFDPWGGYGFDNCATLTNEQFERIFYKNNWGFQVTVFNIYMTSGGTNWGNLGHPLGYSSYDYGAPISEDRAVVRAKYSETKLGANFLKVTPSYLTSTPLNYTNGSYTDSTALAVTPVLGNGSNTNLYVVRHSAYNSYNSTPYKFTIPTSIGNVTIPQLNHLSDHLTLDGRDSKVHVSDYNVGGTNLIYSTGEIFTCQKYQNKTVLVLYGGENETHEFALDSSCTPVASNSDTIYSQPNGSYLIVQWNVTPMKQELQCGDLDIYLLWRNDAYNWWVLDLPAAEPESNYTQPNQTSVIIEGGYLMRTATIANDVLYLTGDINATTTFGVIGSPPYSSISFNGNATGTSPFTINFAAPTLNLPNFTTAVWSSINSLPELSSTYSDNLWTVANRTSTFNQFQPTTPEVLYASDYGYHSGSLLYRGHFTSLSGASLNLSISTQGGYAYGYSAYLNSTLLYQYPGISTSESHNITLSLSILQPNSLYVVTLLIDHMGLTENGSPGNNTMREPRGLLSYSLVDTSSSTAVPMTWKLTGNLRGESYVDKTRGPLNEGGLFFERQGYHLPGAPVNDSTIFTTNSSSSPFDGVNGGVSFFATSFALNLPTPEYDIPLAFVFTNSSAGSRPTKFRALLYVNGFQFGKYVNHIGPQTVYPVPEGILNYNGQNYVGVSLWSLEEDNTVNVKLDGFELRASNTPVMSGRGRSVNLSYELPADGWMPREGAY